MPFVVVDTHNGSCFAGFLSSRNEHNHSVVLEDARQLIELSCRSLAGFAYEGPIGDKTPVMTPVVEQIILTYPVAIYTCTKEATDAILNCPNSDFKFDFWTRTKDQVLNK